MNWWDRPPFALSAMEKRMLRRAPWHDYRRPSKYMITLMASPLLPPLSTISGNPSVKDPGHPDYARAVPTRVGSFFARALEEWRESRRWAIKVHEVVIMPDHVHLCIEVFRNLPTILGGVLSSLTGRAGNYLRDYLREFPAEYEHLRRGALEKLRRYSAESWQIASREGSFIPVEDIRFFKKSFQDSISMEDERWERQLAYVRDNPRRLLIKRLHGNLYRDRWWITIGDRVYEAVGNIFLLKHPEIVCVRYSSKFSAQEMEENRRRWRRCLDNDGVLVSPFIHPEEKGMMAEAEEAGGKIIKVCTKGFSERFAPSGADFDRMAAHRLLLIGPADYSPGKETLRRNVAMELNKVAEILATHPEVARVKRKPATGR